MIIKSRFELIEYIEYILWKVKIELIDYLSSGIIDFYILQDMQSWLIMIYHYYVMIKGHRIW
jgi:hypothetical protein